MFLKLWLTCPAVRDVCLLVVFEDLILAVMLIPSESFCFSVKFVAQNRYERLDCQRLSQGKSLDWKYCRTVTGCNEINMMSLFNTIPRTKRSHGHKRIQHPNVKKSSKPRTLQDTFNDLLSNKQKPLGIHHICTILFSLPVNNLKDLRDFGLDKGGVDPFSPKYRLSSIICDVASFRLFKPVRSEPLHDNNRKFPSIFRLPTKESMLLTSATFLIEKRS